MTPADAAALLALGVVLAGHLLLVAAGVHTMLRPTVLLAAVLAHRLLPARLLFRRSVRLYGLAICTVGTFGVLAALAGRPRVAGVVAALVYGAFAGYLALVRALRGALPCGCWGPAGRAGAAAVLRSLVVTLAAVAVAAWSG